MALWNKLKTGLDRAGEAAQHALDEGRVRLDIARIRKLADKAAQGLGYAVFKAREAGSDLDAETYGRYRATIVEHEVELKRQEEQLETFKAERKKR